MLTRFYHIMQNFVHKIFIGTKKELMTLLNETSGQIKRFSEMHSDARVENLLDTHGLDPVFPFNHTRFQ